MSDISNLTKIDLQRSDIHTLRNLARSIGVSQPTSKKKDALIADIMAIVTGKEEPEFKNANRGRPAKVVDYVYPQGVMSWGLAALSKEKPYVVQTHFSGVVVIGDNGAKIKKLKFVDSESDVDISAALVKKFGLKDNDIVDYELVDGKVSINKINGKAINQKREKFEGKTIVFGATNLLKIEQNTQKYKIVEKLCGKVFVVPESNIDQYVGKDISLLPVPKLEDTEILNNFFEAVSMASYYQKRGNTTILVLSNYFNLISSMQNTNGAVDVQVAQYLQRFANAGGTFVAFAPSMFENIDGLKFDNID